MTQLGHLAAFAVSMAFVESAMVVYLREIYFPEGFQFPLREPDLLIYGTEVARETATLAMLGVVSRIAAPSRWGRLASFLFLFGLWDIWYYIWLKVLLDWPESLLTWDVLFLIPVPWISPVLGPLLVSLLMVGSACWTMQLVKRGKVPSIGLTRGSGIAFGAIVVLYTFLSDGIVLFIRGGAKAVTEFVPTRFNWFAFLAGYALCATIIIRALLRPSERS